MKKVRLYIQEVLKYQREMIIEIPKDMGEDELNNILDKAQWKSQTASDVPYAIEKLNNTIKVVKNPDDDLSSPWDTEVEIDDLDYIE